MKRITTAILLCTALCAAVFAQNASDFKTDGKGTITGYEGWDKVIAIPEKIGNVTITAITGNGFQKQDITSLTLPASIKTIGENAFVGNKLTSLIIPAGVTIGNDAFKGNQLTSLTVGDKVNVGAGAFAENQLTSLIIPAGVTIGNNAFEGNQLTSLTVGDKVSIRGGAFVGNKLTSLTVGNDVTIGDHAFEGNQLTSLTVGDRVFIGNNAFTNNKLTSLTVGNNVIIGKFAFYENRNLKTLVLGEGVYLEFLENYESPSINLHAYYDYMCNSKKAGTYDNTVKYADKKEGDFEFVQTKYGAVITNYNGSLQAVQIPSTLGGAAVKGIGKGAFAGKNLTRIQLPEGLVFIGERAFGYIGNLGEGERTNQLTSVTIPNSVTYIGESAFSNNKLTSVTIPNSVTYILDRAFYKNQLTSVTIPNSVTYIGSEAFYDNSLSSVTIGAGVTLQGIRCFGYYQQSFVETYNNGGKRAGTYTNTSGSTWTRK